MPADGRVRDLLRRVCETNATPEEVCRDSPELLAEVRERWAKLRALDAGLEALFPSSTQVDESSAGLAVAPAPEFPGYEIAESLGAGGMGVVYKARELSTGRVVALKVVHPHLRRLPGFVERLTREAEIGRRVVHENVVRTLGLVTDATRAASRQALVTEYVEGQTLRALLAEMGRVPEQLCRHVGREIAKGLAAIHAVGAVHRDLKPENVLITKDDVVKVLDLGVAKLLDSAGNLSQDAFVGSLRYAAPEQIRRGGAALDGRADLFALGLTLFELSTGSYAFPSDDAPPSRLGGLDTVAKRAGELNPQLSAIFEELLATLLENDREKRFAGAAEVADVLKQGEESRWWRDRSSAIRRATRNAPRRIRISRETALHGRDAELSLLRVALACASKGDGRVVLVQGEAGVGKSRLIDEFVAQIVEQGGDIHSLHGGYAPGGAATASGAFSTAYREFFGDEELEPALGVRLSESSALVSAFAALLRGEPPPGGTEAMTKDALQTAFARTTQSLAAERPTVVVIEDLHLAPDEGRALFAALAHAVPGHRVLLVGTARRTLDSQWAAALSRLAHVSRLMIRRLGLRDLTALLADALRSDHAAEDLAPQIDQKSDGNPYFVFELLRGLRESRLLTQSADGAWTTATVIRDIASPSSITDLIAARIAELLPQEREMLEIAACCGFEFDPLLVGDVLGLARLPLLRRLGTLESAHRLVRSSGRRYVFDHHQVQEVLYAGLSQTHRESYHAAIAESLERTSGAAGREPMEIDGDLCAALAGHFLDGADGVRALRYLDAALDHLETGARLDGAARLLDRALSTPDLLVGERRCGHLLRRSRCFKRSGRLAEEAKVLREANAIADDVAGPALRAELRLRLGVNLLETSHRDDALDVLAESGALFQEVGDLKGEARVTRMRGTALAVLGRYDEALAAGQRGIDLARAAGDAHDEAAAIGQLGNMFLMFGRHEEARGYLERSVELCRRTGDARTAGRVAANLGNAFWTVGRFAEARAQYEEYRARSIEFGDRMGEARAIGNLAGVLTSLGYFADAKAHGERCIVLLRECVSQTSEAIALGSLGGLLLWLGRHDEAKARIDRSLEMGRDLGSARIQACALGYLGMQLCEFGRAVDALPVHQRQAAIAEEAGDRDAEAAALALLGAAEAEAGRPGEAVVHLDAAIAAARELDVPTTLILAAAERACLPGGDPPAAARLLQEFGARADVTAVMRSQRLLWQATHMPAHLAEASRLLDFLVAHAPADCRASMIENVRLHRDIRAAGPAPAMS